MAARSFLGAGDVLIEAIVNGVGQGLEGPFKANKLAVKPNVDKKTSTSKGRDDYGQTLESVNLPLPADLTLELKEVVGSVLAMALMGTASAMTAVPGSLVDHAVTAKKGKWAEIGKLNLADGTGTVVEHQAARTGTYAAKAGNTGNFTASAVTVANLTRTGVYTGTFTSATAFTVVGPDGVAVSSGNTGTAFNVGGLTFTLTAGGTAAVAGDGFTITVAASGADVTLTEGVDYKLNRRLGLIMLLPTSAAPDATVFKVTGSYTGASGTRISGATQSEVRCRIKFDGVNMADGTDVTAEVYEAVLSAESEFDFLPDDFGNVTLSGTAKTPTGKTAPFTVDMKTAA